MPITEEKLGKVAALIKDMQDIIYSGEQKYDRRRQGMDSKLIDLQHVLDKAVIDGTLESNGHEYFLDIKEGS